MTYDGYGNIKSKNGVAYTYGDAVWKDLLTKVGDQTITYDAQGNPTHYLGHTLTWEKGRQLKSFDGNTYTYNANGIRTSKTVNEIRHEYLLEGTKILRETWGNNTLIPLYDNEDSVCGIVYNNEPFYFQKNLQGDIIAIVDKDAVPVAHYAYDAWGVCTVVSDTSDCAIATINSYRYRGYYYDPEIGMYYLQSRYYDPAVGRFVNGDEVLVAIATKNIFGKNIFCYCNNNSIMLTDMRGFVPKGSEVPPETSGYVPPKKGPRKGREKNGKMGWVDINGNVWIPDPSDHAGDHWDVTGSDGSYVNVGRNGHTWGGKGKVRLPKKSKRHIEWGAIIGGIFVVLLVVALILICAGIIYFTGGAALDFI